MRRALLVTCPNFLGGPMAQREVLEVTCDRCGRKQAQDKAEANNAKELILKIEIVGTKSVDVSYDDLCRKCRDAVVNYGSKMAKVDVKTEDQTSPSK